jgi:hypothetical protein
MVHGIEDAELVQGPCLAEAFLRCQSFLENLLNTQVVEFDSSDEEPDFATRLQENTQLVLNKKLKAQLETVELAAEDANSMVLDIIDIDGRQKSI